ncbi:hypothetical protein Goari_010326, partial [Gossypium aridum]|nr:hypothetical protein [Gossypium aridum]
MVNLFVSPSFRFSTLMRFGRINLPCALLILTKEPLLSSGVILLTR